MEIILLFIFLGSLCFFLFKNRVQYKLPPGPKSLPFIGSWLFITRTKGIFDWTLDREITKHKLTTLNLGFITMFVINDFDLVKELFDKNEFSGKNPVKSSLKNRSFDMKPQGIIQTHGLQWSIQRRFSSKILKDFGFGKSSIENSIHFEVDELIETLLGDNNSDFFLKSDFNVPIINVLWQLVAGTRFTKDNPEDLKMIDNVTTLFSSPRTFFGKWKIAKCQKQLRDYMYSIVQQHNGNLDHENPGCFVDVYLTEVSKDVDKSKYTKEDLVGCMNDFFAAGTETSSTTLKWIVHYLTLNQDVQDKCRGEIKSVIGQSQVKAIGIQSLPYVQATISEVQRVSRVAPLTLPHFTLGETKVGDFKFPSKSMFMANLSYIMNDPLYFKDPELFKPERFLSNDGSYVKNDRVIPFSIGKRYCMGELLARSEVFIFTVSMLQKIKFLPPTRHATPDPANYHVNFSRIPDDFYVHISDDV